MSGESKARPLCPLCGSDDIVVEATARWHFDNQDWVVSDTYDNDFYCCSCDSEFKQANWIEEKQIAKRKS